MRSMAETLHHLESVKPTTQLDKRPAFNWVFTPDFRHQLFFGDPPSLRCLALASGESCSSTVSFWPFFSFLSFFDLKFAAAKLEHFKHWKTFWNNMCWKWHLYLHPRQCLIWMEPHILAQYLYETMKRDTCKMVHLPFVPKQWTNKNQYLWMFVAVWSWGQDFFSSLPQVWVNWSNICWKNRDTAWFY